MGSGEQPVITQKTCIVICRFLVGFIASKIFLGYFDFLAGIAYIFYPFSALCLLVIFIGSGKKELIDNSILVLGVLAVIYILIPVVVEAIYNKMKK
ncbi:hypothetical protein [Pelosinus baikalensis]|uniref:Uncharacterized protein n=1 Tax=Pelosinus baikalensis TaxID=2892015 RepID=A0ABS8HKT4_9FIRM|nr:hypothetical protein [Pelosinus baikalensis]MCC5463788.1 hypothetical protein [Pelosinus baikalensis]